MSKSISKRLIDAAESYAHLRSMSAISKTAYGAESAINALKAFKQLAEEVENALKSTIDEYAALNIAASRAIRTRTDREALWRELDKEYQATFIQIGFENTGRWRSTIFEKRAKLGLEGAE